MTQMPPANGSATIALLFEKFNRPLVATSLMAPDIAQSSISTPIGRQVSRLRVVRAKSLPVPDWAGSGVTRFRGDGN